MRNDKDRSYSKAGRHPLLSIKIEKAALVPRKTPRRRTWWKKIEKTAISIRAVLTNYVKAIRHTCKGIENNGESFTIRDWMRGVREDGKNGWLFISSNADTHFPQAGYLHVVVHRHSRAAGDGENRNRRVWIFADELPTLHKLPDPDV